MIGATACVRRIADVLATMPDEAWLTPSESQRLAALRHRQRREQYLAGHWLLRQLLAAQLGLDGHRVALQERANLPPRFVATSDRGAPIRLSLSHSGAFVAAAIGAAPIGIDIEARPRDLHAIAHLLIDPDEPPAAVDTDTLLERWVIKEAWLKRDQRSALPAALAAIRIHAATTDIASDVVTYRTDEWQLAIASRDCSFAECAVRPARWRLYEPLTPALPLAVARAGGASAAARA